MNATAATPANPIRLHPRRLLLPLEFFEVLTGLDPEKARSLCEDGSLTAFNLATAVDGKRAKLHVCRESVERYEPGHTFKPNACLDEIIAKTLPAIGSASASTATVGATELAFRWCCSSERIVSLVRAGELRAVGKRPSPKATRRIAYLSAFNFLKGRVLI
jgi:hypothetical protein